MDDESALDLKQYVAILRRGKAMVALITLVLTALAVLIAVVQSPTYRAGAQVLREPPPVDPLAQSTNGLQPQRDLNNEIRELESTKAREAVSKVYAGPLAVTSVRGRVVATDADIIEISASGGDPQEVTKLVNTYVDAYLKFRTEQQVAALLETGNAVRQKADELNKRVAAVSAPLIALDSQIATAPPLQQAELQRQRTAKAAELAAQLTPLQTQQSFYQQQLDKVELTAGIRQAGGLRLLAPATVPSAPVSPKPRRNALLGLIFGLMLGAGAAFAREHLDTIVRSKDTLEAESQLPTLGVIPRLPGGMGKARSEVVTISEHNSLAAEAYRTLRTSLKFLRSEDGCRVFQITSPAAAEGKTLTALNLAVAVTQAGDSAIVVGCDLRRPRLDTLAQAHQGPGLTSVVMGDAELHDAIERHEDVDLAILRTGPLQPDPSELLSRARTGSLIAALRASYDVVILDCPPLLPVSDSLILAGYSDAVLLVVTEGKTSRRSLSRALELLRQVNAPVRGTVLNGSRGGIGYGYGYGYGYSYGQSSRAPRNRRWPGRGRRTASRPPNQNGLRPNPDRATTDERVPERR